MRSMFNRPARAGQMRVVRTVSPLRDLLSVALLCLGILACYAVSSALDEKDARREAAPVATALEGETEAEAFERGRQAGRSEMAATVGAAYRRGRVAGQQLCQREGLL